jgi:hypothetical protein
LQISVNVRKSGIIIRNSPDSRLFILPLHLAYEWNALLDRQVDDIVDIPFKLVKLGSLHRPDRF